MKYGRATTDLHAKSNMHHQTNIAIQTNVCTSYSGTEAKQKYNWWPGVSWIKSFPEVISGEYSDPYYKPFYEIGAHLPHAIKQTNVSNHSCSPMQRKAFLKKSIKF